MSAEDVTRWMLPEPAPEPQKVAEPKPRKGDVKPAETHTGTDPLGRAIGPLEDHREIKQVRNRAGMIVTPNRDGSIPEPTRRKK